MDAEACAERHAPPRAGRRSTKNPAAILILQPAGGEYGSTMKTNLISRIVKCVFLALIACALGSPLAHALPHRTWVSGVGDDANPCSRTAPCNTFAAAISKTA